MAKEIFQSTLPREERRVSYLCIIKQILFQSTLPREERRGARIGCPGGVYISIHAPTRGATFSFPAIKAPIVFQSTLPREERQSLDLQGFADYHFNPRSHERSDQCNTPTGHIKNFNPRSHERSDSFSVLHDPNMIISIHAPTRGATY